MKTVTVMYNEKTGRWEPKFKGQWTGRDASLVGSNIMRWYKRYCKSIRLEQFNKQKEDKNVQSAINDLQGAGRGIVNPMNVK